jgi:hypothetical protein
VLTPTAYQAINTPIDVSGTSFTRGSSIPFVPSSIERIGTDAQSSGSTAAYYGRYLIANPYSQGSVPETVGGASVPAGFGGEVFIYSAMIKPGSSPPQEAGVVTPRTFSRPANTSPLSRPTCAVLAK